MLIHPRQDLDEVVRGRVIEADGSADQIRGCAASAVPEDLVAFADLLAGEIEKSRRSDTGFARKPMPLAMRHERKIAWLQKAVFSSLDFEPASTRCHYVEHQPTLHRRQRKRPRRGELGATVEGPAHPQEVQCFAERNPPRYTSRSYIQRMPPRRSIRPVNCGRTSMN